MQYLRCSCLRLYVRRCNQLHRNILALPVRLGGLGRETRPLKQVANHRVFKEYPQKSQIWKSETSSLIGTCLTLPNLGFLWEFFKYPKISKNGNPLFFPVMVILVRHCVFTGLLCFKPCEAILRENFADHMMPLSCFYLGRKRGAIVYKEAWFLLWSRL